MQIVDGSACVLLGGHRIHLVRILSDIFRISRRGSSVVGLFGIGAAITLLTGKSVLFSGFRQVAFGLAAAAVTYGIGTLIGVSLAG